MPNIANPKCGDPKCAKELTEEDLEQVSGGVGGGDTTGANILVAGTYTVHCPFGDCNGHSSVFQTFGSDKYLNEINNNPFGTLSCCGATVVLKSASVAMCTKNLISMQADVIYNKG